jgi:hypothetical protein
MMKNTKSACVIAFLLSVSFCVSCTPGIRLNTQGYNSAVTGTYNVIFYGCNFSDDLETIAFLDRADDRFTFEPFAPEFNYRVKKGVDANEALTEAYNFVNCNTSFRSAQLSRIMAPNGETLGYEVRPLYSPIRYGVEDVLYIDYRLKDYRVVITIRLVPSVERMLEGGNGTDWGR